MNSTKISALIKKNFAIIRSEEDAKARHVRKSDELSSTVDDLEDKRIDLVERINTCTISVTETANGLAEAIKKRHLLETELDSINADMDSDAGKSLSNAALSVLSDAISEKNAYLAAFIGDMDFSERSSLDARNAVSILTAELDSTLAEMKIIARESELLDCIIDLQYNHIANLRGNNDLLTSLLLPRVEIKSGGGK